MTNQIRLLDDPQLYISPVELYQLAQSLGRQDPCWCGSGRKFKKCHGIRANQPPVSLEELDSEFQRRMRARTCVHPTRRECNGRIVHAHTIQRNGSLNRIARAGHVYYYRPSRSHTARHKHTWAPELTGLKIATTFTGFCEHHDRSTFDELDNEPFVADPKQVFLLGYRALARECFLKRGQLELIKYLRDVADRGMGVIDQIAKQRELSWSELGAKLTSAQFRDDYGQYCDWLLSQRWDQVESLTFCLRELPKVMCSGCFFPEYDFKGIPVQDIGETRSHLSWVSCTSFGTDVGGAVCFVWPRKYRNRISSFLDSLLGSPKEQQCTLLTQMMFEHIENVAIAPDWWDGISQSTRTELEARLSEMTNDESDAKPPDYLCWKGTELCDWHIIDTLRNQDGAGSKCD